MNSVFYFIIIIIIIVFFFWGGGEGLFQAQDFWGVLIFVSILIIIIVTWKPELYPLVYANVSTRSLWDNTLMILKLTYQ